MYDDQDPPAKWLDATLRDLARELLADPKTYWIGERDPKNHICWAAADRLALLKFWQPIETAPHETRVLLGWYQNGAWFCETGMASHGWSRNGVSNMSRHGCATHWQPLPEGPALSVPQSSGLAREVRK